MGEQHVGQWPQQLVGPAGAHVPQRLPRQPLRGAVPGEPRIPSVSIGLW